MIRQTWSAIAPGLWQLERLDDGECALRTVAVSLGAGHVVGGPTLALVIGAMAGLAPEVRSAVEVAGAVGWLLAPNQYHHLGLPAWTAAFPDARAVASEPARERLRRRSPVALGSLDPLRAALPPHLTLVEPPGTRNGEVWLVARTATGTVWVVCDALFDFAKTPRSVNGVIGWLAGVSPGLRVGPFKWLGLRDRPAYTSWLRERLTVDPPDLVVPAHGRPIDDIPAIRRVIDATFG
ncbi:MAG: hypothetical protein ABMB14_31015 [Myxococcota bacterium]